MAIKGKQTTITITGPGTGGTDIISGCCVRSIGDVNFSAGTIDATCHGSDNIKKVVKGIVDLGTLDVEILYKDDTTATSLYSALTSSNSYTVVITIPATTSETLTFSAIVTGMSESHPIEGLLAQKITLTLDGVTAPTWA